MSVVAAPALAARRAPTLLRVADQHPQPWKNGGGVTTELACHPRGATLDTFEWRVSIARVASGGPFSLFPNVQRTLALVEGSGLQLDVAGAVLPPLSVGCDPVTFAGDVPVSAHLLAGPVIDFNVMTRRDRFASSVTTLRGTQSLSLASGGAVVLLAVGGGIQIGPDGAEVTSPLALEKGDACVIHDGAAAALHIRAAHDASCLVAILRPLPISTDAESPPPLLPDPSGL